MAEWTGDERSQTLTIGHVRANAWMHGGCGVYATVEPRDCRSIDEAKAAAEQALREMHDALSAHFAPALRWHVLGDQCDASLDDWILLASTGLWVVRHRSGPRITSDPSCTLDAEQSRRAAEAALRSLGVVFRTEGE